MSTATIGGMTREAWLARRRESIGASEIAAAIGVSPYQTPVELWQRKLGLMAEQDESEAMRWGTLLEPLILQEYQHRTGRRVTRTQDFLVHPGYPCLTATLDAVCDDGRLVEVKTASAWAKDWGEEGSDEVPEHYLAQVAQQMAIAGAEVADVAVLIGGQRLKIYTVKRNEHLLDRIVAKGVQFWQCVEARTPPTWGRMDAQALAVMYPDCQGEADWTIETAEIVDQLVTQYEADKGGRELIETRMEQHKNMILQLMENARIGRLPDGRCVRRFRQEVAERPVSYVAKAHVRHYFTIVKGER